MNVNAILRHDLPVNRANLHRCFFMYQKSIVSTTYRADTYRNKVVQDGVIDIEAGSELKDLYFTPRSERFSYQGKVTKQGKFYDVSLVLNVPKDRPEVAQTVKALGANKIFLVYKDKNGFIKLLPNMRLDDDLTVGNVNFLKLQFKGKFKWKPSFWDVNDISNGFSVNSGSVELAPTLFTLTTNSNRGCITMQAPDGNLWKVCILSDGSLDSTLI